MHLILVVVVLVLLRVSEAVAMIVPMPAARSQFAPRRNRDPTAKSNERDARRRLDAVAKTRRDNDAGKPHHQPDQQGREHVSGAGLKRRAGRFGLGPAALPGNQRDRHPMIRDDRMQYAGTGDGAYEQQLGSIVHASSPSSLWCSP